MSYRHWMSIMMWWWHLLPLLRSSIPSSRGSGGEYGWVQSVLVATSSDTPVRVPRKDSTGAHGGDEMRLWLAPCSPEVGKMGRSQRSNCTFTAQSTIVESVGTEENSSVKPEGEEEAESSDGEDPETSSEIGGADQMASYIIHFANVVELY